MQFAGILVMFRPEAFASGVEALEALEGVEVHHQEAASGKVVVVAETEDVRGQEQTLHRLREVPGVLVAEPVYYYRPEDGDAGADAEAPAAEAPGTADTNAEPEEDRR